MKAEGDVRKAEENYATILASTETKEAEAEIKRLVAQRKDVKIQVSSYKAEHVRAQRQVDDAKQDTDRLQGARMLSPDICLQRS